MTSEPEISSILNSFEMNMDPADLSDQKEAEVIGYGEISSIISLKEVPEFALKRLPLFVNEQDAGEYIKIYEEYCRILIDAGLNIPHSQTHVIVKNELPTVLYICQKKLPAVQFCHKLIHSLSEKQLRTLFQRVINNTEKIWNYSDRHVPELQCALDTQLSNWVLEGDVNTGVLYYIDTSTPLYRLKDIEQLDPELFLKSAMPGLRWFIRTFFLKDIINRYYDFKSVMIDLSANLYKEKRPDLIPLMTEQINNCPRMSNNPLTIKETESYYKEDKRIWQIVQFSRRIHRWITRKIFRRRYEFTLPASIER